MSQKVERIALVTTIAVSVLVSILDLLGVLDTIPWLAGRTSAITLLVVALVAGYIASERFGKLERIERSVISSTERILSSLSGVEARLFPTTEESFEHLAKSIVEAEHKIDHAALAPPVSRRQPYARKWEQAIARVLKANKVMYRYVTTLSTDTTRWGRVNRHLSNLDIQKYYVRYYDASARTIPVLSFVLIDDREVIMRYPYEPGQSETSLSIRHPDVAELFAAYYRSIWGQAKPLNRDNIQEIMKQMDRSPSNGSERTD
jgi:hypothetical protein